MLKSCTYAQTLSNLLIGDNLKMTEKLLNPFAHNIYYSYVAHLNLTQIYRTMIELMSQMLAYKKTIKSLLKANILVYYQGLLY